MQIVLPPALGSTSHKGEAGRVLALCGSRTMPGAAILVARSAQRAGAGLVEMGCLDPELMTVIPVAAPEAVLRELAPAQLAATLEREVERFRPDALVAGPGLGDDMRTHELLLAFLAVSPGTPRVLDADGLNALDGETEQLRGSVGQLVITPHPGEAERLLGRAVPRDASSRVEAARELAERSGAVVALKGAHTLIAIAGAEPVANDTGNPGMATAGTGDVLAGILGAYLARWAAAGERGPSVALAAARAAVHVHGLAGDQAAERLGPRALIASDLIAELPSAQARLSAG